jgi:hypothetical protein
MSNDHCHGGLNEILAQDLGDEGEGSRCSQITFNYLELGLVLIWHFIPNNLHVERTRYLRCMHNLLGNYFEMIYIMICQ